ncbi:MAG: hypothetical protein ABEN55_24015 [Bradymonadaceae bacterium]
MGKPSWKSFVDNIKSGGGGSGYDDRVPAGAASSGMAAVQREVIEEMSAGLRRTAAKIEEALVDLADLDDAIREASARERRLKLVEQFNARRADAVEARRNYLIQREAIGFFRNDCVIEQYPIPPKRTVVGPRGEDGSVDSCEDEAAERREELEVVGK